MYCVNKIDLSSSEFNELCKLNKRATIAPAIKQNRSQRNLFIFTPRTTLQANIQVL